MSVFVCVACGSAAVPLHRGQCAPHPSPERDARTYAPHRMTASVSAVTNHAKAAKRFGLTVVECVRPAASMIEERERVDYPAPTKTKANLRRRRILIARRDATRRPRPRGVLAR